MVMGARSYWVGWPCFADRVFQIPVSWQTALENLLHNDAGHCKTIWYLMDEERIRKLAGLAVAG
jgi:hypothetical protein